MTSSRLYAGPVAIDDTGDGGGAADKEDVGAGGVGPNFLATIKAFGSLTD